MSGYSYNTNATKWSQIGTAPDLGRCENPCERGSLRRMPAYNALRGAAPGQVQDDTPIPLEKCRGERWMDGSTVRTWGVIGSGRQGVWGVDRLRWTGRDVFVVGPAVRAQKRYRSQAVRSTVPLGVGTTSDGLGAHLYERSKVGVRRWRPDNQVLSGWCK